jgi:hypothetical protein
MRLLQLLRSESQTTTTITCCRTCTDKRPRQPSVSRSHKLQHHILRSKMHLVKMQPQDQVFNQGRTRGYHFTRNSLQHSRIAKCDARYAAAVQRHELQQLSCCGPSKHKLARRSTSKGQFGGGEFRFYCRITTVRMLAQHQYVPENIVRILGPYL